MAVRRLVTPDVYIIQIADGPLGPPQVGMIMSREHQLDVVNGHEGTTYLCSCGFDSHEQGDQISPSPDEFHAELIRDYKRVYPRA